jgi:hypothetical protein
MRRNPTPAVTAKMYSHIAVTTVAITALIALFANGDQHDAVAAETDTVVQAPHEDVAKKTPDEPQQADNDFGSWGDDVDFGAPSSSVAYEGGSWMPDNGVWQPDLAGPLVNPDAQSGLTPAERDQLARAAARGATGRAEADQQG